ncbi:hypothetical protein ACFWUU_40440 [Kribbella sp. NPDC058693]|uniref:hypothetical protein n=1 Tax=Kribbella sp. NPDC058693 TaxID=3346602 RepID=UPI003657C999
MSGLQVAGDVAEVLGAETVAQLRADAPSWSEAACRDCGRPIDVRVEAAAVVLLIGPAEMPGNLTVMCLTHPACSASELRPMPWEEAQAYYHPAPEQTHDMNAVAAVWDNARPVLLVSFDAPEVAIEADSGELTDAVAAAFLAQGWELVAQLDTNPAARPDDLVCRYSLDPQPAGGRRTGRLEILIGGEPLADIPAMVTGQAWRTAVEKTGELALYLGPLDLHQWGSEVRLDAVDQAMHAGRLVGCTARPHITG